MALSIGPVCVEHGLILFTSFAEFQWGVLNLIHAFILAKVESGMDGEVLKEVAKTAGVRHATPTYGEYDLHVDVAFATKEELDRFIFDKIRRIEGVREILVLIAFGSYES
jgi:DNA-binding Lrp family transcriptional regulator